MQFSEYVKMAQRTSNTEFAGDKITNGLMGLCGETGEAMDIWKKCRFQGKAFDETARGHMIREIGDVAWYLAEIMTGMMMLTGTTPEEILQGNIDKLKARYPDGFEVEKSEHRAKNDL